MRFMMFMYPQLEEKDWQPTAEGLAEMGRYNEELRKAGMLLSLDGLSSASTARARPPSPTVPSPRPRRSSAATG